MKKTGFTAMISLLLCVTSVTVCAEQNDFYIMRQKDHKRPSLDPCQSYIEENGGIFMGPDEPVIYLTFDAGYENGNVEKTVDALDRHNAKGTFFVLDNIIRRDTDLLIKMAEHGHTVANHSAHHKNMTAMTAEQIDMELSGLRSAYKELTGKNMSMFFRPPEGKCSRSMLEKVSALGYKTVFWSFAYADWDNNKQPDPEYAIKLILDNTHNGMIILLHPTSKTNASILDRLLDEWENRGYRFGTLDELI